MKRCPGVLFLSLVACTTPNAAPPYPQDGGIADRVSGGEARPDGRPVGDARRDGSKPGDGFTCAPNAFLGCKAGAVLMRCNAAGDGTVLVDCAPYLCDATNRRCSQCDPKSPPTCQGSDLLTCMADGLLVKTTCPGGCVAGSCAGCTSRPFYKDSDGDSFGSPASKLDACTLPFGYVANNLDCDDFDPAAHPGQTAFFEQPTKGTGSFDYNCNKLAEQEAPSLVACVISGMSCVGDGWMATVPACGAVGVWAKCNKQGGGPTGCGTTTFTKTQRCH